MLPVYCVLYFFRPKNECWKLKAVSVWILKIDVYHHVRLISGDIIWIKK